MNTTMNEPNLTGKSVLVTGGGRGIGRATALAVSRCGARVILTARGRAEIEAVAAEIGAFGGESTAITCDLAQLHDVRRLFEAAGPVDILINNAGVIAPIAKVVLSDPEEWLHNIEVNLVGVYLTCRYALPAMLERGWGRIINVSAGAARGTTVGWSAYSAAKAGVEAFTSVLAREIEGQGVLVNAVRPGIVDTEMQVEIRGSSAERFSSENVERFRGYKERGLLRQPDDPARLMVWLLSEQATEIHGQVLAIDDPEVAARVGLQPMGR